MSGRSATAERGPFGEDELACLRILSTIDRATRAACRRSHSIITGTSPLVLRRRPRFAAGTRTLAWLARASHGGRRPEGLVITHQIDAARRLHNASLALGRERMTLLYWAAIVDDLPWNRFGLRPGLSTETATCRTVAAIVAWRYGGSEPIPPAPVTRLRIEPGGGDAQHGTDGPVPLPPRRRAPLRWIAGPVNKNRQQHLSMIDEAPVARSMRLPASL